MEAEESNRTGDGRGAGQGGERACTHGQQMLKRTERAIPPARICGRTLTSCALLGRRRKETDKLCSSGSRKRASRASSEKCPGCAVSPPRRMRAAAAAGCFSFLSPPPYHLLLLLLLSSCWSSSSRASPRSGALSSSATAAAELSSDPLFGAFLCSCTAQQQTVPTAVKSRPAPFCCFRLPEDS